MRPDRIIVGECRAGEALDMLQAMTTGQDGSLSTGHANTPSDMPDPPRLVVLVPTNGGITAAALLPTDDGTFASPTAPAGAGSIHYMTADTEELPPFAWPIAADVRVHAGQTTVFE